MTKPILVIDEGTTSTRAMLFAPDGACLGTAQRPLTQYYPAPGRVEHDANEIWALTLECAREMVTQAGGPDRIACIGITNQRETVVFWDRRTGESVAPAIVWQDRRTAETCHDLIVAGHEPMVQDRTGLLLDPYFSGSKMGWALANWPQLNELGDNLAVGTVESYLVYRLTGGLHITDATNASRTALMAIEQGGWDSELLDLFGVPAALLPEIVDCAGSFGSTQPDLFGAPIPVTGLAGDQQAASIGQACLAPGQTKATYGTGAFILTNTGAQMPRSKNRLLGTIASQIGGERCFALEGSVFVAGSVVKWLRDEVGLIDSAEETAALAASVPDNGGVSFVPALSGLGAPYWRPDARGAITGLSFSTGRAHIVRAALEAVTHQSLDLKATFAADGAVWADLRIDGGMVSNDWLAQDLADMLDLCVERPLFIETTALGAAMLAGVGAGLFPTLAAAASMRKGATAFHPQPYPLAAARCRAWEGAVAAVLEAAGDRG
ncbi:glycerol kinase [Sphingobium sp. CECT 9361]|uniref:glycerol kinase n=1 Tax=Sphingobium sp. CECT 9361 TaxID=2845384 RepID=UPI001E441980|nr:glycerol kinase [Sphingobium sp. CECT 9361]CAH0349321.1 Glycerol kinase [Sphingobium sp. CECT 9361]